MNKFEFNERSLRPLPLDPLFSPMVKNHKAYLSAVRLTKKAVTVLIAIERNQNQIARFETQIFGDEENQYQANYHYIERLIKTLLWTKGGFRIYLSCPKDLGMYIKSVYHKEGSRRFDVLFMERVYGKPFEIILRPYSKIPEANETSKPIGRHLSGYRIGFDAGGSDRKVSAVIDGEAVYSEEVVWHPKLESDPEYHIAGIKDSLLRAKSYLPKVDGIGVSSAGVYIDNEVKVASLFVKVPDDLFEQKVRRLFIDLAHELGDVPLEVANDGDVTALSGAMGLNDTNVMGIAMGTSEAAGYVDHEGHITGWLNELAFVPVDDSLHAMEDEWSGDIGCGVKYFSQDAIIKLAKAALIPLDENLSPADKLKVVQKLMMEKDPRAIEIYETMGVYLGYGVAYYATYYDIKHILVLGRVLSGPGGELIVERANELLKNEFPELSQKMEIQLPDEKSRRVGQSIAAASLPEV